LYGALLDETAGSFSGSGKLCQIEFVAVDEGHCVLQLTKSGAAKETLFLDPDSKIIPISLQDGYFSNDGYNFTETPSSNKTISVIVDAENEIYESNKANNLLATTIFVNLRPTPVTLYTPSEITTSSMKLTWIESTESDFAEYQIYQSITSGQLGSLVGTVKEKTTINYIVSGLKGSTTYYFTIRVVDANGAAGDSNQVSVTTLPTPVTLSPPANPKASSLDLTWTKNTDQSFTKYEIYRSASQGQLGTLVTSIISQSQTTYTVTGLAASTTYYFTIRVINPKNLFSDSNQVSATTAPTPSTLSNPTNSKTTSLDLSWSKNTDQGFTKHEIYQSTTQGQTGTLIATISDQAQTTYTARNLSASTTY
jgi:predicted phage tail protein